MLNCEQMLTAATPMSVARSGGRDLVAVMVREGPPDSPKGVKLSHDNLASKALSLICEGATQRDGIALLVAPMFHIACGALINSHIMIGGTYAIAPLYAPQVMLQVIRQHKVAHVLLAPTLVQLMLDRA